MGGAGGRDLAGRQQEKDQIGIGHGVLQVFMHQPFPQGHSLLGVPALSVPAN